MSNGRCSRLWLSDVAPDLFDVARDRGFDGWPRPGYRTSPPTAGWVRLVKATQVNWGYIHIEELGGLGMDTALPIAHLHLQLGG